MRQGDCKVRAIRGNQGGADGLMGDRAAASMLCESPSLCLKPFYQAALADRLTECHQYTLHSYSKGGNEVKIILDKGDLPAGGGSEDKE